MIGQRGVHETVSFGEVDQRIYGQDKPIIKREEIAENSVNTLIMRCARVQNCIQ